MTYSRREFLKDLSFAGAACLFVNPIRLLAEPLSAGKKRYLLVGSENSVCVIDLATQEARLIPLWFKPHSYLQHPLDPHRIWTNVKWGTSAAEFDITTGAVTQRLECPPNTEFYGHGIFSPKGDILFNVRVDLQTGLGHLIGFDSTNGKQVSDYQITPGGLHDCRMLPDQSILVASNGLRRTVGMSPYEGDRVEHASLVHVDLNSGKVLNKMFIKNDKQILGHLVITKDGTIIATGTPTRHDYAGSVAYVSLKGKTPLTRVQWPAATEKALKGECLSIAVDEENHLAGISNPDSSRVCFVDIRTGKPAGEITNLPTAKSLAYDKTAKAFLCGDKSVLNDAHMNAAPYSVTSTSSKKIGTLDGSHSVIMEV